jgi:hypothetical protein
MSARALACVLVVLMFAPLSAWKNPRKSETLNTPIFGTHDWIAFKGYVLAGRPAFIKNNLNRYFIGTEAPDNGFKPANAEGGYNDASACHCILFDEDGNVTRDRAELRVRQEFDKALGALADGNPRLAAFYAGALAHYMGDLGQFYHIMGSQSHGGLRINLATVLTKSHWRARFDTQTGQNINVAANGIAKLLRMMIEDD